MFFQVEGIRFVNIFDSNVVNNEGERDGSGLVDVEAWGVLGRVVVTSGKDLFKLLVGEFAGLFETVDGLINNHVDVTVGANFVLQVVFTDDFLGDVASMNAHVLESV